MSEIARVSELRVGYRPTEYLREVMASNFLNPELDEETRKSLMATILFKSWRRRIMRKDAYLRERNRSILSADTRLRQLSHDNVYLSGEGKISGSVSIDKQRKFGRIIVESRLNDLVAIGANRILETIPSIEKPSDNVGEIRLLYADVNPQNLASDDQLEIAGNKFRSYMRHPSARALYNLTPIQIIDHETMAKFESVENYYD